MHEGPGLNKFSLHMWVMLKHEESLVEEHDEEKKMKQKNKNVRKEHNNSGRSAHK